MDKNQFIDEYLNGKRPIEQDKWGLPSESELDQDEALFDALLAQNQKVPLLARRFRGGLLAAAAVLIAAVALFAWWDFKPQGQPQLAETKEVPVEQKDTIKVIEKPHESKSQSSHEKFEDGTSDVCRRESLTPYPSPWRGEKRSLPPRGEVGGGLCCRQPLLLPHATRGADGRLQ